MSYQQNTTECPCVVRIGTAEVLSHDTAITALLAASVDMIPRTIFGSKQDMESSRLLCQARSVHTRRTSLLLSLLLPLLSSVRVLAQSLCDVTTRTEPIRVENATGVDILRAAVKCNGSAVRVNWVGRVIVGVPIAISVGTSLSVTGDDVQAEVHGSASRTVGTRLFEVSPGGSLTLSRLKITGGFAEGGGAVYSQYANLTLDNCIFDGNVATDGSGGAVWADGGNLTVVGGEFLANNASRYGGAVHAVDGTLVIQGGTKFDGNSAIGGGAVYCGLGELGGSKPEGICSILDAVFVSNSAARDSQGSVEDISYIDGGGAAMFLSASVDVSGSFFDDNYARHSGGALHGGIYTNMSVNGCTFVNNTSDNYGGAISASTMTLGGYTQLANNVALDDGGAVVGWDADGTITFNDVVCKGNEAANNGGCFHGAGRGVVNRGTSMLNNSAAGNGGSILAFEGSRISVHGGIFSGATSKRGGFIYAEDDTRVTITGGLIEDNFSSSRGGALYCNGNTPSFVLIEGGTFKNNRALESGGAIAVWGDGVVTIAGGSFEKNNAIFYGGFAFVENGARLKCDGANVRGNHAGDQGGGIYARQATWVNSSCDLIENDSPQGAAIYLTNVLSATFEDHNVTRNLASGGSVVYLAVSSVVARYIRFDSSEIQDHTFNRAIQMDERTKLDAHRCVFNGWLGDAVVFNANPESGSLILEGCDFNRSSASLAVISPNSGAVIRNAAVSDFTFNNALGTTDSPLALVDRALNCRDPDACETQGCVDSSLGVLCPCLKGGKCLDDGGELSLTIETPPDVETFRPDPVSYELRVSSSGSGTTDAIWQLEFAATDLVLEVFPSSGVLPPGGSVLVQVSGIPSGRDVGGNLTSKFILSSVISATFVPTAVDSITVVATLYMCKAFEYARPLYNDDDDDGVSCEQCANIASEVGVNCTYPGATEGMLPIQAGYWRSSRASREVLACLHSKACVGATNISSADDYCADGYKGPYCAVCTDGYGKGVSSTCHSCNDANTPLLYVAGTMFSLAMLLLLVVSVVFLIGGLDAIDTVQHSLTRTFSEKGPRADSRDVFGPPVFDFASARKTSKVGPRAKSRSKLACPTSALTFDVERCGGKDWAKTARISSSDSDHPCGTYQMRTEPLGVVDGVGFELSGETSKDVTTMKDVSAPRGARQMPVAGLAVGGPHADMDVDVNFTRRGASRCCGFAEKGNHWISVLPLDKLRILVVVWQIIAVCSSITGVEFPVSYTRFLSWITVVNLDIGSIFVASCLLPSVNFYVRLLVTTLSPLGLAAVLLLTYHLAKIRAGIGSAGVIARRAAWSRHVAAGLLLTFLVFTSASTAIFKTFACDDEVGDGESYLRDDYSLRCNTPRHRIFKLYAGLMILVYPIGIPVLYFTILWKNRSLLNPRIDTKPNLTDGEARGAGHSSTLSITSKTQTKKTYSFHEFQELEAKVKARRTHPDLVPSMFLWKDFGPNLYYYEVVECGRRMLLTGVLIFIAPQSSSQLAIACIFAFASLLGFELMRPHMDPADSWLYRLGCVIIFLSNFLALLIKMDGAEVKSREVFGGVLVAINILLVLAVLLTSWFAVQQSVDDSRGEDNTLTIAKAMLTAEQYAAQSTGLTRSATAPMSSAFPSTRRDDPPLPDGSIIKTGSPTYQNRHRSCVTDVSESEFANPDLAAVGGVDAATLEKLQHLS